MTRASTVRALVVGGSGRTGRRVVEGLLAAGCPVSVLSRRPRPHDGVPTIAGDLSEPAAWSAALDEVSSVAVSVEPPCDASGAEAVMHRGVAALAAEAATGFRLEQGDRGDGSTSRDTVAAACVQLLLRTAGVPISFEVFDDPGAAGVSWPAALAMLTPDSSVMWR